MGEAADSIRTSRDGYILVHLELDDLPGHPNPVNFPVLKFLQSVDINSIILDSLLVDNTWLLSLSWEGGRQLRNRHLRFWSLWQPWKLPLDIPIPDKIVNKFETEVPRSDLSPGKYRIEIAIVDPWSSREYIRPMFGTLSTGDVILGNTEECENYIRSLSSNVFGYLERYLADEDTQNRLQTLERRSSNGDDR